jgi:hypothetical protein
MMMFSILSLSHQKAVVVLVTLVACLLAVGANAFVVVVVPTAIAGGGSSSMSMSISTTTQLLASSAEEDESTTVVTEDNNNNINNINDNDDDDDDESCWYTTWAKESGIKINDKLIIRNTYDEERGKGGIHCGGESGESGGTQESKIKALEVLATIPRSLIISSIDAPVRAIEAASNANKPLSWVTDITASTLVALHPLPEDDGIDIDNAKQAEEAKIKLINSWIHGGWATQGDDLGPPESNFGPKHVTGSLISTGSDNDYNIYAKFRMPCHPVIHRASLGLLVLTGCTEINARNELCLRGSTYRSLRDALEPLVLNSSPRENGSKREKRCWDVADILSKVLSRVTTIQFDNNDNDNDKGGDSSSSSMATSYAIVPIHERLEHSLKENTKLITSNNDGKDEILLIATRDINVGEPITRDYTKSPKLIGNTNTNNDESSNNESDGSSNNESSNDEEVDDDDDDGSALRLLLQFGLPPNAWPEEELTVDK